MKRFLMVLAVCVTGCAAMFADDPSTQLAPGEKMREEGEPCVRHHQCYTAWCANGVCTMRDP